MGRDKERQDCGPSGHWLAGWWEKQEMTGWMEGPTQELMNSLAVPKGSGIPQESDRNLGGQNDI